MDKVRKEQYYRSEVYGFYLWFDCKIRKSVVEKHAKINIWVQSLFLIAFCVFFGCRDFSVMALFDMAFAGAVAGVLYDIFGHVVMNWMVVFFETRKYNAELEFVKGSYVKIADAEALKSWLAILKDELKSYDETILGWYLTKDKIKMCEEMIANAGGIENAAVSETACHSPVEKQSLPEVIANNAPLDEIRIMESCIQKLEEMKKVCPASVYDKYDQMLEEMQAAIICVRKNPQFSSFMDKVATYYIPDFESLLLIYADLQSFDVCEREHMIENLVVGLTEYIRNEKKTFADSLDMQFMISSSALLDSINNSRFDKKS